MGIISLSSTVWFQYQSPIHLRSFIVIVLSDTATLTQVRKALGACKQCEPRINKARDQFVVVSQKKLVLG